MLFVTLLLHSKSNQSPPPPTSPIHHHPHSHQYLITLHHPHPPSSRKSRKLIMKTQTSINTLCFTFFLFLKQSVCLDSGYEACVPKDCGDGRNISYPFYIKGLQDPSCGYPGFELHCRNSSSSITFSGSDFVIESIDYRNRNFRLQNTAIFPTKDESCPSKIRNLTFDPNRFRNVSDTNLLLIYNCSRDPDWPVDLERYNIRSCEKSSREVLVVLQNDRNMINVSKHCSDSGDQIVRTPVELRGGEERSLVVDGQNYAEVLGRGFLMRWVAPDCGECERSGGRCGVNMTTFQFLCFCPDRPHKLSCKPGKILSSV